MGIGDLERNATDTYEQGMLVVPEVIRASEGEIPVKQYNLAILRSLLSFERAEGHLLVTNKRLIFRAPGRSIAGRTTMQHEFAVNDIAGVEAHRNFKFSFLHLIGGILLIMICMMIGAWIVSVNNGMSPALGTFIGLLLFAAGMVAFFTTQKEFKFKLAVLGFSLGAAGGSGIPLLSVFSNRNTEGGGILAVLMPLAVIAALITLFLFFMRPNLEIKFKPKMPAPVINIRRGYGAIGFTEVIPTMETESVIREVGAIIHDLQQLGDLGIEKWTK